MYRNSNFVFVFLMKIWKILCSALAKGPIDPKTVKVKTKQKKTVTFIWVFIVLEIFILLCKSLESYKEKKPSKFALTNFLDDWKLKGFSKPGSIQKVLQYDFAFLGKLYRTFMNYSTKSKVKLKFLSHLQNSNNKVFEVG